MHLDWKNVEFPSDTETVKERVEDRLTWTPKSLGFEGSSVEIRHT